MSLDPSVSLAGVMKHVKGHSSFMWNQRNADRRLRWQTGYWARSLDIAALPRLLPYVNQQRARHASGDIDAALEQPVATMLEE